MRSRVITLTTDFGLSDHFVGTMKGVIAAIAPGAQVVDISHEVGAFDITEGAFVLAQAYRYFPKGTVHVAVVDPGVGTSRRPILAEVGGQCFVAPDNGLLSMIYARERHKVRVVTAERYFLKNVSRTFHGRDIFAPTAAHLARGVAPARFGRLVTDYLRLNLDKPERTARRGWTGAVLKVDRFGNLITNFEAAEFGAIREQPFELTVGPQAIAKVASNYAECAPGELFVIEGSSGYFEISTSQASAARMLGCGAGAPVDLRLL